MPMALLRPISGSGSTAMLTQIFDSFGPDSFIGRVASVIMGSTETTFYAIAVYFAAVGSQENPPCGSGCFGRRFHRLCHVRTEHSSFFDDALRFLGIVLAAKKSDDLLMMQSRCFPGWMPEFLTRSGRILPLFFFCCFSKILTILIGQPSQSSGANQTAGIRWIAGWSRKSHCFPKWQGNKYPRCP